MADVKSWCERTADADSYGYTRMSVRAKRYRARQKISF